MMTIKSTIEINLQELENIKLAKNKAKLQCNLNNWYSRLAE